MAQNKKADEPVRDGQNYVAIHHRRWFWPSAVIVALILIFGFLASLLAVSLGVRHFAEGRAGFYGANKPMMVRGDGFGMTGRHRFSNQNRLEGVVTAVTGSSFTIAGNGSTNTIQTDSSTQFQNGNQVKVNDTVIAIGTTNNGTFTATNIVINP